MERWTIVNKLTLLLFIMLTLVYREDLNISWDVLILLLYCCSNISIYLFKKRHIISILLLFSIVLIGSASIYVNPFFILLIPLSILELFHQWTAKTIIPFILTIIPVFYIPHNLQTIYVLVFIYTSIIFMMGKFYYSKIMYLEEQVDFMRIDNDQLRKQIIENDTFLKQSAYTYKLEERNRISQQIHDDVGHAITGALIQMEATKRLLKTDQEKAEELLQNAIGITQNGIEQIRLTLKDMKPTTEQVGINRLKLVIDEFASRHDKRTIFTYQGDTMRISAIQWEVIHKNITESLTNSLKYAKESTQITIDMHVLNKLVKVEVKDNGKTTNTFEKGLGIIGMEERTASLDGKIIIDGTDGFSVTTLLPLL